MSGAFVGRRHELGELQRAATSARHHEAAVVAIMGEAGSGKTRLVDEACARLEPHTLLEIAFRPSDDAVGSPLLAVAKELLDDPWLASRPPAHELRQAVLGRDPEVGTGPRGELTVIVLRSLLDAAEQRLTVLRLEDLHWASHPDGRKLLDDLAAALRARTRRNEPCRLLVVTTARTGAMTTDQQESVSSLLRAAGSSVELELGPLSELEIDRMIRPDLEQPPSGPLLAQIAAVTAGLPLLVEEAAAVLASGMDPAHLDSVRRMLPPSAWQLSRRRLEGLSAEDRRVLTVAALAPDPTIDLLAAALDIQPDEVMDVFDRACQHQVMVGSSTGTRFGHPTVVEALVDGLSGDRRAHNHRLLADACQRTGAPLMDRARHLVAAGRAAPSDDETTVVLERAIGHALAAADHRLAAQLAESVATRLAGSTETRRRCDAHYWAALGYFRDRSPQLCADHTKRSMALARQLDDDQAIGRALTIGSRLVLTTSVGSDAFDHIEQLLDSSKALDEGLRARLLGDLSEFHTFSGRAEKGERYARAAVDHAAASEDPAASAAAAFSLGMSQWAQLQLSDARAELEKSAQWADRSDDTMYQCWGRGRLPLLYAMEGRASLAATAAAEAEKIASDAGSSSEVALAIGIQLGAAVARGRFGEVDELAPHALDLLRRTDYPWAVVAITRPLAVRHAVVGDLDKALDLLGLWHRLRGRSPACAEPYLRWLAGHEPGPVAIDQAQLSARLSTVGLTDVLWTAELSVDDDRSAIAAARRALVDANGFGVVSPPECPHLLPRTIASLSRRLGDRELSVEHAELACRLADEADLRLELAFAEVERARCLGSTGPDEAALELAAGLADDLGLRPLASKIEVLAAERGLSVSSSPLLARSRAILFTDIVNSTVVNREMGDVAYVGLLSDHDRALQACLDANGGHQFQHSGDGIGAWFDETSAAVACAGEMHAAIAHVADHRSADLTVRIGVIQGEMIERGSDMSGLDLSRANRVMSVGTSGETIVDAVVADAVGNEFAMIERGSFDLKGFDHPHELFQVVGLADSQAGNGGLRASAGGRVWRTTAGPTH